MKVIKRGEIPETKPMHATCNNCHSEIEFVAMEVNRVFDQRNGDFYKFDCPVHKACYAARLSAQKFPRWGRLTELAPMQRRMGIRI